MISTVVLLSLYVARTASALNLLPPIRIMRPLDDVHTYCEEDIQELCRSLDTNIQKDPISYSYESSSDINVEKDMLKDSSYYPKTMADYSQTNLDASEGNEERGDGNIHQEIARRLTDEKSDMVSRSRKYSLAIGVRIGPKELEKLVERAKDNTRFLNYGPNTDTCLWNVFDNKQVSRKCASALMYLNDTNNFSPIEYANESAYIKRTSISVSIPMAAFFLLLLCYILVGELYSQEDDDIKKHQTSDDKMVDEYCEHTNIDEPKNTLLIAVPLEDA